MLIQLIGGIGLFLLGMGLMTDGLKAAAGDSLRQILLRFTGRPATSFFSGAAITTIIQSSSATTVATIGFVSAGLMTFPQAAGVVFGASLGTTSTGWIVSLLGLKFSVTVLALPLVGIGAFLKLLGRNRIASYGMAVAGFGLIFVGIDALQAGMEALSKQVRPENFPAPTLFGKLLLVVIGILMTVVMQSSSAAVATTLAAFYAGTLSLPQSAALIIGQSIGTTVTAALASIGASVPARRTALAHILFNAASGALGFLGMPLFLGLVRWLEQERGISPGAVSLAAFHTSFTFLGVVLLLPLIRPYAAWITRLVPDRGPSLTRNLDDSLLSVPAVALETTRRTAMGIADELLVFTGNVLAGTSQKPSAANRLALAETAITNTLHFLATIHAPSSGGNGTGPKVELVHVMDHLEGLRETLSDSQSAGLLAIDPLLKDALQHLRETVETARHWMHAGKDSDAPKKIEALAETLAGIRRRNRPLLLQQVAESRSAPEKSLKMLDALQWADRVSYHVWRVVFHLNQAGESGGSLPDPAAEKTAS